MIKKIIETIHNNKSFLLTSHINLEGDALGSELAFYMVLKKLKKYVVIFNNDRTPYIYNFLPFVNSIKNFIYEDKFDVSIVLDCSDSSRAGKVRDYIGRSKCIINIDHHISNTHFGDINWVEPKAASTSQMLYKIFEKLKIIDRKIALCLYTGIFTDTGSFSYANTTSDVHKVAFNLLRYNIYPHKISENLHSLCEPEDLKLISKVLASLKFDKYKKICWAKIYRWKEKNYDLTEIIFSILKLLKEIEVFILFKSISKKKIRINFRSKFSVDVNKVAKFFGGGGHKRASGTTIQDTMANVEGKIISFVQKYIDKKFKKNYDTKRRLYSHK